MMRSITAYFKQKEHLRSDITPEILQEKRLAKSVIYVVGLIVYYFISTQIMVLSLKKIVTFHTADTVMRLFLYIGPIVGLVQLPYHPKHFGFNLNKMGYNIGIGLIVGLFLGAIAAFYRYQLFMGGNKSFGVYFIPLDIITIWITYPLSVLAQETIIKGFYQSYFVAVFEGFRFKKLLAITVSSLLFAQIHIWYGGMPVFFAAFVFSFFLGWIYEQSRSLLGVFIIHLLAGAGLYLFTSF